MPKRRTASRRELAAATERRYALGDIAALDPNHARIDASRSAAALAAARAAVVEADGLLRSLLRLPAAEPLEPRGTLDLPAPPPLTQARGALDQRPDLTALLAESRAAGAEMDLGRALGRPDLGVRLGYHREDTDTIVLGGLTVTLPAFQRGQGALAAGLARSGRVKIELETARERAGAQLEAAYGSYQQHAALADCLRVVGAAERRGQRTARPPQLRGGGAGPARLSDDPPRCAAGAHGGDRSPPRGRPPPRHDRLHCRSAAMTARLALSLLCTLGLAAACERAAQPGRTTAAPEAPAADAHEEEENAIHLTEDMVRDLRISTAPVTERTGAQQVSVLGQLAADETRYAQVAPPTDGQVLQVLAELNAQVGPGTPLARLRSAELGRARAERLTADVRRDVAAQALERKRTLAAERIVAAREVQEADAALRAADAEARAAAARLRALGVGDGDDADDPSAFVLRSPIAGRVIDRKAFWASTPDPARRCSPWPTCRACGWWRRCSSATPSPSRQEPWPISPWRRCRAGSSTAG